MVILTWTKHYKQVKRISPCQSNLIFSSDIILPIFCGLPLVLWGVCAAPSSCFLSIINLFSVCYSIWNLTGIHKFLWKNHFTLWKLPWCCSNSSAVVQSMSKGSPVCAGLLTHTDQETLGPEPLMKTIWRHILNVRQALSASSLSGGSMKKLALH